MSWKPAVPPPPVGGAPFGIGVLVGGDGDAFPSRVVEGLADGRTDGLFERLARGLGVVAPAVPLDDTAGLAELLVVGDDVGGSAAEGEEVVQAETAAQANTTAMPQPRARHCNGLFTTNVRLREKINLGKGGRHWGTCSGAA